MQLRTTIFPAAAFSACVTLGTIGCTISAQAQAPQLTMQTEQKAHPELVAAIRDVERSLKVLQNSPNDFGGYKDKAIKDLVFSIHNLKGALYYRLKLDDAALDRAE